MSKWNWSKTDDGRSSTAGKPDPLPPPTRRELRESEIRRKLTPARQGRPPAKIETTEDSAGRQIPTRLIPDRPCRDRPMKAFIETVDRDQFLAALDSHPDNAKYNNDEGFTSKWQDLAVMLTKPEWNSGPKAPSFAAKCRKLNISLKELVEWYSDYQRLSGTLQMMNQVPAIMQQVALDALPKRVHCPRCDGVGVVIDGYMDVDDGAGGMKKEAITRSCPQCKGSAEVEAPVDRYARETVLEAAKITGQKAPMVAIQQNFGVGLEDDVAEVGRLLNGD